MSKDCFVGAVIERGKITSVSSGAYTVESIDRPGIVSIPTTSINLDTFSVGDIVYFFVCQDGTGRIISGADLASHGIPDGAITTAMIHDAAVTVAKMLLDEPLTFNLLCDRINFAGSKNTYTMIRFLDNTSDIYGNGIAIGGGGSTIIGGGESASNIVSDTTRYPTASGQERMIVANDDSILFLSNVQNGTASARLFRMDTNGSFYVNNGGIFVGPNKTDTYSQSGVLIHPDGYICMTNPSSVGSRAGIYFAWNNAASATSYIRESSSGIIELNGLLKVSKGIDPHASIGSGTTSHAVALKNYFTNYKSSTPRSKFITFYDSTNQNGSVTFGYFLAGYDSNPYGGFFSCHYQNAYYIGIYGGTYVQNTIQFATSDIRLKENVEDCTIEALPIINAIPIRQFDWKDGRGHWNIGMVADEIQEIDPNLKVGGDYDGYDDEDVINCKQVNSFYLQGYEIKAIQELSAENTKLKEKVSDLEKRIERLEALLMKEN